MTTEISSPADLQLNRTMTAAEWEAMDLKKSTVDYESYARINALETAASTGDPFTPSLDSPISDIPNKRSKLVFDANDFRLDVGKPATPEVIAGSECHTLEDDGILHFGIGRIPFLGATAHNLIMRASMSASLTSKKKKLITRVYDSSDTLTRTGGEDNIVLAAGTTKQTITINNILLDTDFVTDDVGRIEVELKAATDTDNAHTGNMRVFECEVQDV